MAEPDTTSAGRASTDNVEPRSKTGRPATKSYDPIVSVLRDVTLDLPLGPG